MSAPCLVCGGVFGPSKLPGLLQCTTCGFVTADVQLSTEALERLYSAEYFAGQEYKDYLGEQTLIERHFRQRLRTLLRYTGDPSGQRLFEVGCAYGFFLNVARAEFAHVQGIDIAREAVAYASRTLGLDVAAGDFLDQPFQAPVDVVCMWDTIEHLAEPGRYVERAATVLRPGGHLTITTGDISSPVARLRGAKWRQIHPPTHLHYFSRHTLTRLLDRHGFDVAYCGYDGMYRSVDTIAFIILALRHRQERLYRALKAAGLLEWSLYLNLRDIVFMIARKR